VAHSGPQFIEALHYKLKGRGFDSQCCEWDSSFTQSFRPHYIPRADSVSTTHEFQDYCL